MEMMSNDASPPRILRAEKQTAPFVKQEPLPTSTREGATQREQAAMAAEHIHSIAREKYDDCHYGNEMKNEEIRVTPFSAFVRADDDR